MPRKLLYRSDFLPYHVTARTNNRETFKLPLEQLWQIIGDECLNLILVYEAEFHALVLMPNHFHLLLTVPKYDLGKVMSIFYRNPVRAKLCELVESYRFSTLQGLMGMAHLPFPLSFTRPGMDLILPPLESPEYLQWLNRPFPKEAEGLIQRGLRKKLFDVIIDRKTRRSFEPLNHLT